MVRIEASRCRMCSRVFRSPVTAPAQKPAAAAARIERAGGQPAVMATVDTAAPSGRLPSTVRSGKSSTRKVR